MSQSLICYESKQEVVCVWNVMAHAQKPDFVFRQRGWVHLNRRGRQFSRLLVAEVRASAVVDTPCSEVVWWVLATHSIRQFPLHFPSCASSCAITFQLDCTIYYSSTTPIVARTRLKFTLNILCLACYYLSVPWIYCFWFARCFWSSKSERNYAASVISN